MYNKTLLPLGMLLGLSLVGCSGGDGPVLGDVSGTATFQGAPLSGATVMFIPEKGPVAAAVTDAEGEYTVQPGVAVGPAKITVQVTVAGASSGPSTAPPTTNDSAATANAMMAYARQQRESKQKETGPKSIVPERYTEVSKTPLSIEIKEGSNDVPIEITP